MSEAKRKRSLRRKLLTQQPFCIYCGGGNVSETVDHMPPTAIFRGKQRPKGLEFASCYECNHGSRAADQVVSLLSRIYPDSRTDLERAEIRKVIRAIKNNFPGLLEEMLPSPRQEGLFSAHKKKLPGDGGALNVGGPMLNRHVQLFGARLGFAMHFNRTGRIVPLEGAVAVRWFTNYDAVTGGIPIDLFKLVGKPETLSQGRVHVGDQFNVASVATSDRSLHFATFRLSFAIVAFVSENKLDMPALSGLLRHPPGCLKASRTVSPQL